MSPDTQHMIRAVAEKFEVRGWKPNTVCNKANVVGTAARGVYFCKGCQAMINGVPSSDEHEIPPPDLLQADGAWALLVALRKRRDALFSGELSNGYRRTAEAFTIGAALLKWLDSEGDALALLTAAFQLTEEGRK